jgi:agmatinase
VSLDDTLRAFDPSGPGGGGGLWGLPFTVEEAALVVLPVPWEVTVSYGAGAARAPEAILKASTQVDLYDSRYPDSWKRGVALAPLPEDLKRQGEALRERALAFLAAYASGAGEPDATLLDEVNGGCEEMVARVRRDASELLERGKLVAVLGGDHSAPLGLMQALGDRYPELGMLHVDAHSDLRNAYEGFVHSHASIMFNALRIPALTKLVQVGIRDTCDEEVELVRRSAGRVTVFGDRDVVRRRFGGEIYAGIADEIVSALPERVYVSFDVDGLDPALCPGTGTPVPGGLQFEEALYLVDRVVESGREIVGFDLCEVSPGSDPEDEWDANVGARVLYRLSSASLSRKALT